MVASGSAKYIQSCLRFRSKCGHAKGMWIKGSRSQPPASRSRTLMSWSSVSRFASVQPAEPAPMMMMS